MSLILIGFGLVFLWSGVSGWRESRDHFERGEKTEAVVVALEDTYLRADSGRPLKAYRALYAYQDKEGKEYQLRGQRISTQKSAFTIGARKTVYVDPDKPMEVQDTPAKVFSSQAFAVVAGAGMTAFGIAALVLDWDL